MITFLIPSIGRETLLRTIDSLYKQTNNSWECYVGFDGIRESDINFNLPKDERINYRFYQEKSGVVNTNKFGHSCAGHVRNKLIDETIRGKSKWIGFVDDDDSLTEDYVEELSVIGNDYDICIFTMSYDPTNSKLIPTPQTRKVQHCNVGISFCVKSDFIRKTNLRFVQNTGEDYIFLAQAELMGAKILFTDKICYRVRW